MRTSIFFDIMEPEKKKKINGFGKKLLIFSAVAWIASFIIHMFVTSGLMFFTFSNVQSADGTAEETFTVDLGSSQGDEHFEPQLVSAANESQESTHVVQTTAESSEIVITSVETSEVLIPDSSSDLTAAAQASALFSESLAGGDTGGSAGFFGLSAGGKKFVYVIDMSDSMNAGEKFASALRELNRSINSLAADMDFYVIFYNTSYLAMPASKLVNASGANKKKYLRWVNGVRPSGGTNPESAALYALSLKPDAIWLLSDGNFPDDCTVQITLSNNGRTPIHTLAFGDQAGVEQLKSLASANNGNFRIVSSY